MNTLYVIELHQPDNTPKSVFVNAFGRKHSAPTVDEVSYVEL